MKGMREILVSFVVAMATLGTYAYLKKEIRSAARAQDNAEPTQAAEIQEDTRVSLNWGVEALGAREVRRKPAALKKITVAVIDTGCDLNHPDLAANIWRNPGESGLDEFGRPKATNGIDDDGNGFVDDVYGWNFADGTNVIMDEHGHGTHIAGIAKSVSPDVSLMILKYYDAKSTGAQNLENTIRAIRYAVDMGANIINYSGGGMLKSRQEEETIRWAATRGVLVVAAAGNEGLNSDFMHFYPADYDLPNILSVGAIDRHGSLMDLSNYGLNTVDIAAPGKNIYSTLPSGQYGYMSGTSQATAFATGVAALLMAEDARMQDPPTLIKHLLGHGRPDSRLKSRIRSGSVLNAKAAIRGLGLSLAADYKSLEHND